MNSRLENVKDPEEKAFLKQFINYSQKMKQTYRGYYTDFYNKQWMSELIRKYVGTIDEECYRFFGGYENAERQILGFFPSKDYPYEFPIGCIKIVVKTGIGKSLTHRDFLGALMGLGIKRDMIGDIIVTNFGAYIILHNNVMDYIIWNLNSIGRYQSIEINEISFEQIEYKEENIKEVYASVASLRADSVLSSGFGLSRTACAKLIQNDRARCNGLSISSNTLLKEGDYATIKGYGKIKLHEVIGTSKKGKLRICIYKYI